MALDPTTKLLNAIRRAARKRDAAKVVLADAEEDVAVLIREGFEMGVSGPVIAEAAGLSKPRAYQIRDGRR